MALHTTTVLTMVNAPAERVRIALADYRELRPAILSSHFTGYQVIEGGQGAGSTVRWTLNPARWGTGQAREWLVRVEEVDGALVESDTHSPAVTTWTVTEAANGRSAVKVLLTCEVPGGLRGAMARIRASNLRKVYGEVVWKLYEHFAADRGAAGR